jgi:hypothetical protein
MNDHSQIPLNRASKRPCFSAAALLLLLFFCSSGPALGADGDESVIFLHHSTGGAVYSQGDVAEWIADYNTTHAAAYQVTERGYPNSPYPWSNYPYDYWNLWINGACDSDSANIECMNSLTQNYDVIIFKHCFPGAAVQEDINTPDISSSRKSLENYKLQYRALREMMDGYPNNRFIVWTLAPLHRLSTNTGEAQRAKAFVDWVKTDWLTEDGRAHDNIFIFDFWGLAAESDPNPTSGQVNTLKYQYEKSHDNSDSHPNRTANETIGPLFAQFIIDTIEHTTSPDNPPDNDPPSNDPPADDPPADDPPTNPPDSPNTSEGGGDSGGCFIHLAAQDP